jgi:site-specific DNA-methyltransferase (adenine-specific)
VTKGIKGISVDNSNRESVSAIAGDRREVLADGVELYLGDCRSILPTLGKVDAVVTSPPYNTLPPTAKASGLHAERKSGRNLWLEKAAAGYADQRPENEYQEWLNGILAQCADCALGLVWVNHKVRYRDGVAIHPVRMIPLPIYAEVIWNRGGSMALNCKRFAPSHEVILAFGEPHYWDDKNNILMSVWDIPQAQRDLGNDHPCPYPESIIRPLIESSCPKSGVILDPFMGSGTTGVAAVKLGRKFIGIEIEPKYFEIACRRIGDALKQPDMFIEKPKPATQVSFAELWKAPYWNEEGTAPA